MIDSKNSSVYEVDENALEKKVHNEAVKMPCVKRKAACEPNRENEHVIYTDANVISNTTNNNCTIVCINEETVSRSAVASINEVTKVSYRKNE